MSIEILLCYLVISYNKRIPIVWMQMVESYQRIRIIYVHPQFQPTFEKDIDFKRATHAI